jgi:hypothetical protein
MRHKGRDTAKEVDVAVAQNHQMTVWRSSPARPMTRHGIPHALRLPDRPLGHQRRERCRASGGRRRPPDRDGHLPLSGETLAAWMSRQPMSLQSICSNVLELSSNRDEITTNEKWRQELDRLRDDCAVALYRYNVTSPTYGLTSFESRPAPKPAMDPR